MTASDATAGKRDDRAPTPPQRRARRPPGLAVKLAVLLATLVLCAVALEIGLWLLGDAGGGWYAAGPQRLEFLERYVERNSDRFRDREFDPVPPAGTERILAVGDSFTFGDGIRDVDDTWPRVLERVASEAGRATQVYNLGVPGTNTAFQRRLLDDYGYGLQPARVVVGFVLNDVEPPGADRAVVHREVFVPLVPIAWLDDRMTRVSYAYSWLRGKKNQVYARFGWKKSYVAYLEELYADDATWSAFAAEARGLVDEARRRGVAVTVALFPFFTAADPYPFTEAHRRVADEFRRAGADVVDLLDVFDPRDTVAWTVSPTDAHPNEAAHARAADAIARSIRDATEDRQESVDDP